MNIVVFLIFECIFRGYYVEELLGNLEIVVWEVGFVRKILIYRNMVGILFGKRGDYEMKYDEFLMFWW